MMVARYLADPLGTGLLPLRFLVLEAADLGALGGACGEGLCPPLRSFPQAAWSPNQRLHRGKGCPEGWAG